MPDPKQQLKESVAAQKKVRDAMIEEARRLEEERKKAQQATKP